ncbi:MAG: hypothetical protein JO112_21335 [Planctomycetes bacterium]|nr:hypothetical protein [Planctomycetota bacterium]
MIPHRLYVGTIGEGLFRSLDAGQTFVRACDGMFVECHVRALAVHPKDPGLLYLGSEQGLFRSTDGAGRWERIESPLNGLQIWSILLLPHAPEVILAGTCPSRLFRSEDGGRTWTEPAAPFVKECPRIMHTRVTTLTADLANPETVWAGVEIDGLWRSRDAGRTWKAVGQGLSSRDIHGLVTIPGNGRPSTLLASTNNDLNRSTDDGETWQPLQIGRSLPWSYCRGLAQQSGRPEVVFLGNGDGPPGTVGVVGRSVDGGQAWQAAHMPGRANSTLWNFAVHPTDPDLTYASSVSGEVYRSVDSGASWEKLAREFGEIRALAWTPEL